ncbi:MAG: acyltransferase family protein [Varibaculum sp.]|nr:acyltransferase family protein [Varibaculum sp.]
MRALGAIAVLGYHAWPDAVQGGFLGVDLFFVLSGFLITALLVRERDRSGRIDIKAFWLRRWRRLFPAVVTVVICTVPLAWLVDINLLARMKTQVLGALTFTYNWVQILTGSSYFEQLSPRLLTNFWTLAVEQQFYIVWPLVFLLLWFLPWRVRWLVPLLLAAGSVALMWVYVGVGEGLENLSRAYMGTDSHSFGLMIGASLALASREPMNPQAHTSRPFRNSLSGLAGLLGLATVLLCFFVVRDDDPVAYPWLTLVVVLASALAIASMTAAHQAGRSLAMLLRQFLELPPLVWLGVRSYGIYLWHWPLLVIWWKLMPDAPAWQTMLLVSTVSVACAALSFRFVENPMRYGGILATLRSWLRFGRRSRSEKSDIFAVPLIYRPRRQARSRHPLIIGVGRVMGVVLAVSLAGCCTVAVVVAPSQTDVEVAFAQAEELSKGDIHNPSGEFEESSSVSVSTSPTPEPEPTELPEAAVTGENITVIGDSVTAMCAADIQARWPGTVVDAQKSRSFYPVKGLMDSYDSAGQLRHYVVVGVPTNGAIPDSFIDSWVQRIGEYRVLILVNGYGPALHPEIAMSNEAITRAAQKYPDQVVIADWQSRASAHPELIYTDYVHPLPEGAWMYSDALAAAFETARQLPPSLSE